MNNNPVRVMVGGGKTHEFENISKARLFAKKKLVAYLLVQKPTEILVERYSSGQLLETKIHPND